MLSPHLVSYHNMSDLGPAVDILVFFFIGENWQDKVSWFTLTLPNQKTASLAFFCEEFLCISSWQMPVVPPVVNRENKTQGHDTCLLHIQPYVQPESHHHQKEKKKNKKTVKCRDWLVLVVWVCSLPDSQTPAEQQQLCLGATCYFKADKFPRKLRVKNWDLINLLPAWREMCSVL